MERRGASQGQRGALTFSNEGRSEASDEVTNEPTNDPTNDPRSEGGAPPSRERRVPMALAVALLLNLVSGVVVSLRLELAVIDGPTYSDDIREMFVRWNTLGSAFSVACMSLSAAGAAELVRRTSGLAKRGAYLIFGALLVQVAASFLFYYLFFGVDLRDGRDGIVSLWQWMGRLRATSWNLLALGALLAGWRERWVRRLALPLAAVSLLANPYDFYAGKLTGLFSGSLARSLMLSSLDALFVGLLLLVLHRGAPLAEAAGGWERASRALDRTARALSARLWISASSITLAMISFGSRDSEGLAKLWMVAVPLGAVAANLFVVSGVFGVGGLTVAEAPRRAFHAAGALLMMGTILSAMQMFHLFHKWPDGGVVAKQLPLATPILSALALCVFAEALSRLAALLPWLEVAERAAASKRLVILSQLVLVGVQYSMTSSPMREPSSYVGLLMITVGALSITLVSQARLCRALAAEIRERNELPAAVVISS